MTKCRKCHRVLRATSSIEAPGGPIGPTCAKRERQEHAAASINADTVAKAREDLEDGAVQPTTRTTTNGNRVHIVIGSTGDTRYLTTTTACTCKAGLKGKHLCRHRAAVILRAA